MRKLAVLTCLLGITSLFVACELPPPPNGQKADAVEPGGEGAAAAGDEAGDDKPCPMAKHGAKGDDKPCNKGKGMHDGKGPHGDGKGGCDCGDPDCDGDCKGHGKGMGHGKGDCDGDCMMGRGHGKGDCDCMMGRGHGWGHGMGGCDCDRGDAPAGERTAMPLIGDKAPSFVAKTTQGEINFPADYAGKWIVFFSHPADFTPVCTTEFMTFAVMEPEFAALNTQLVGLSIDSTYSHIAWLRTIKEKAEYKGMKDVEVKFPVIEDLTMNVAKAYGMLQPGASTTQAVRAVFIIDPEGVVRAMLYYPLSNGRNIEEIKRLVIALQRSTEQKIATPANWQPGEDVIIPPPGSCGMAKERVDQQAAEGYVCKDWFLCFKPDPGAGTAPSIAPAPAPAPTDPAAPAPAPEPTPAPAPAPANP